MIPPRCVKCHAVRCPFSAEYWQRGDSFPVVSNVQIGRSFLSYHNTVLQRQAPQLEWGKDFRQLITAIFHVKCSTSRRILSGSEIADLNTNASGLS